MMYVPKSKQIPYLIFFNILLVPGQPSEQSPHAKSTTYLKIYESEYKYSEVIHIQKKDP